MDKSFYFPKARLFSVRYTPWHKKLPYYKTRKRRPAFMYTRHANAGHLYLFWLEATWRMPWLPHAAFSKGWDACWRQLNGIAPEGVTSKGDPADE